MAESPLLERLAADLAGEQADATGVVERFTAQVQRMGTPVVEPATEPGWELFSFVWIGEAPHGVLLQLNRVSDPLDPADTLLRPIGDGRVHALTLQLPSAWLASYQLVVLPEPLPDKGRATLPAQTRAALARSARQDPYARVTIPNKASVASGGVEPPRLGVARGADAPAVELWRHEVPPTERLAPVPSPVNGTELGLHRWSHSAAGPASPVVLLGDGEGWADRFPIAAELDARVDAGACPPLHVVMLESGGPVQRQVDYTGTADQLRGLLTAVRDRVGVDGPWIVAGQSLGGLLAARSATLLPDLVAAGIAQSPSLWWPTPPHPWERGRGWFEERAENGGSPILVECGAFEWGLVERARAAAALLTAQGGLIDSREVYGGHDVLWWQATLPQAVVDAVRAVTA